MQPSSFFVQTSASAAPELLDNGGIARVQLTMVMVMHYCWTQFSESNDKPKSATATQEKQQKKRK